MQLTKDEIVGLAKIAAGDWADVREWNYGDVPHPLDNMYLRPLCEELWVVHCSKDRDTYSLTDRGWEALRAYSERASADVGEDCSEADDK